MCSGKSRCTTSQTQLWCTLSRSDVPHSNTIRHQPLWSRLFVPSSKRDICSSRDKCYCMIALIRMRTLLGLRCLCYFTDNNYLNKQCDQIYSVRVILYYQQQYLWCRSLVRFFQIGASTQLNQGYVQKIDVYKTLH